MTSSSTMPDQKNPSISIIIPVYNSDQSLRELSERIYNVFTNVCKESFEIIFVDDCSSNVTTWNTLQDLARTHSFVHAIQFGRNFGQAAAILSGMEHSNGDWIITMDDDLQHRPEDIPLLLEKRHHDVVIGHFRKKECSAFKKISSDIKGCFDVLLLKKPRSLVASPFRLIKKRVTSEILKIKTSRPFPLAMLLSVTSDIVNVDVPHEIRKYGRSNYNFRKSLSLFSNMLFNNSSFMLRCMSVFGISLSVFSIVIGIFFILKRVFSNQIVPGWTSLIVVTLISTGAIIFCLGILGEYVARLLATAENQATWSIKENTQSDKDK